MQQEGPRATLGPRPLPSSSALACPFRRGSAAKGVAPLGHAGRTPTSSLLAMTAAPDVKPFIQKLYSMVDDASTSSIVDWTSGGSAFHIVRMEPFVQEELPRHFKHANLSSFVRQLNTYGFSKSDKDSWIFGHPEFKKGEASRLVNIQRKSSHRPANALPLPDGLAGGADAPPADAEADLLLVDNETAAAGPPAASRADELAVMGRRIEQLNAEVKQARTQQIDTRASIGKIMEFLSQVYHDQRRAVPPSSLPMLSPAATIQEDDEEQQQVAKRMRLGAGAAAGAAAGSLALSSCPPPLPDLGRVGSGGSSLDPFALEPLPLMPSLSRSSSLGAQIASALPTDLRDIALQLVDSTELQDRTIREIRVGSRGGSRVGSVAGDERIADDDVDAYLWDFIEASQELSDATGASR